MKRTDQYACQSYYDDDNVLRDCTCGKCAGNATTNPTGSDLWPEQSATEPQVDELRDRFEQKVARQMVALQYPYGKRTNGEMNEDAHFMRQQAYFKNVMELLDNFITTKRAEWERKYQISPAADMVLTVASNMLKREENLPINMTTVLVMELERIKALKEGK